MSLQNWKDEEAVGLLKSCLGRLKETDPLRTEITKWLTTYEEG